MLWEHAIQHCEQYHGVIPIPISEEENEALQSYMKANHIDKAWLDLERVEHNPVWEIENNTGEKFVFDEIFVIQFISFSCDIKQYCLGDLSFCLCIFNYSYRY